MRKSGVFIIVCLLSSCVFGQGNDKASGKSASFINKMKLERANTLYNNLAYSHAVGLYEELASSEYCISQVIPKLGDCYYNLSNTEKAEKYYAQAVKLDSINPVYYYKYAQVLRANGKYEDSELWMKRYNEYNANDSRVRNFSENEKLVKELSSKSGTYSIWERKDLNSIYSDFGAVPINNKIVFASGRTDNLMVGTHYAWNDKPFLDLYVYDSSNLVKNKVTLYGKKLNSKYHEGPVCFANDNSVMYFTRDNYFHGKRNYSKEGTTHLMIFHADLINGEWDNIVPLPFNSNEYSVGHPAISPNGERLYFASNMPGGIGGSDIYYVEINGNEYDQPVNLGPTINTEGNELFPFINEDGLYFSSDGIAGLGGLDIFFAKRLPGDKFDKPVNLGMPINSSKDDFSFFLNANKRSGYFASNRPGGTGDDDIYEFAVNQLVLKGIVRDTSEQNIPVGKAEVILQNIDGTIIDKCESDNSGNYKFNVAFDNSYFVKAAKEGFIENKKGVSTKGFKGSEIIQNVNIGKEKPFVILGTISDKKTGERLSDVELTIIDTVKQVLILDIKTGVDGLFRKQLENVHLNSHLVYKVMMKKDGYLARTQVFDHYIKDYETNLNEFLEFSLDKIAVGVDIGKLLSINPIYFDLGKWDIRPDAAAELDKIVQAMKDNPGVVIELGSHTDSRGTAKANLELSDKRAKASVEYIISKGIDSIRIYGKGYGKSRLINRCKDGVKCSEAEHAQNRRTEFKVVKF